MAFLKNPTGRQAYTPLSSVSDEQEDVSLEIQRTTRGGKQHARFLPYFLHGLVMTLNCAVLFALVLRYSHSAHQASTKQLEFANEAKVFNGFYTNEINQLFGAPSAALENEWNELLKYENLQVPKEALEDKQIPNAIQLPDGGYFASFWMSHNLRCLRSLHQLLYLDHYSPNMTEEDVGMFRLHTAHCLDALRQSVECTGDTSLLVMQWSPKQKRPMVNLESYSNHQCVDRRVMRQWEKEHSYDVLAPGVLVHPELGPSYPVHDAHGSGLAVWSESDMSA